MVKQAVAETPKEDKAHKKTKYNRFEKFDEIDVTKKNTWPSVIIVSFRMLLCTLAISLTGSIRNSSSPTSRNTGKCLL